MSSKEYQERVSSNSVHQECQAGLSRQGCQERVSSKSFQQKCQARVSSKECQERVSSKSFQQECQERVSCKSVLPRASSKRVLSRVPCKTLLLLDDCAIHLHKEKTSMFISALVSVHSALHKVTAFGFVGSIRFFKPFLGKTAVAPLTKRSISFERLPGFQQLTSDSSSAKGVRGGRTAGVFDTSRRPSSPSNSLLDHLQASQQAGAAAGGGWSQMVFAATKPGDFFFRFGSFFVRFTNYIPEHFQACHMTPGFRGVFERNRLKTESWTLSIQKKTSFGTGVFFCKLL